MVATLLDGKACSATVEAALVNRIESCIKGGITPHLAVVIVGNDPASHVYVGAKIKACQRLGIKSTHIELPENSDEDGSRGTKTLESFNLLMPINLSLS